MVQKGKFTKHYFEGSSRIVSKLGEGTFSHKNTGIMAGGIDYIAQSAQVQTAIDQYIRGLQVPPGPPTQHSIYASPEWTGEAYPSIDWSEVSQNQEPPEGWPRPPKFNDPGDVPGPPVQFGEAITNANVKAGYGYIPNGVEERNLYYYHPDHLGSSSYITDKNGEIIQHTEYMAFGETFVDEHSVSKTMPYLFNAKELDYETGLYYYGARYYDAKTSLWLNTDPLSGYNPVQEVEHYIDGQHNGGIFNPMNMSTYSYTYQNPIRYIDPNGKQVDVVDFIPLVGSGRDIYRGIRDGDALTFGIGVIGLVADVATLGSGTVVKGGLKAGVKIGVKELGESTIKTGSKTIISKAEQLAINKSVGKAAENLITKQLIKKYAGSTVGSQITARFADGTAVVFDNVIVKNGKVQLINETKSGVAKLTKQQARFFEKGESVTFVGNKAKELGILGETASKSNVKTTVTRVKD